MIIISMFFLSTESKSKQKQSCSSVLSLLLDMRTVNTVCLFVVPLLYKPRFNISNVIEKLFYCHGTLLVSRRCALLSFNTHQLYFGSVARWRLAGESFPNARAGHRIPGLARNEGKFASPTHCGIIIVQLIINLINIGTCVMGRQ